MSSTLQASVFTGKNYSDNWHSIKTHRRSHIEADVRHIWEIGIRTIRWDLWSKNNLLWKLFMEVFVSDWWWTSHQSLAHRGLRIFRFCIVSWKDKREPLIKYSMGRQIDVVQKFTGIQNLGENWWWANWIRVEHLPRIHHVAAQPQSSRVTVVIEWNTREFFRTDHTHVNVRRHPMVIKRQRERMRVKCSTRFSICEKIRSRAMVIPRTWIWGKVVFHQWRQSTFTFYFGHI